MDWSFIVKYLPAYTEAAGLTLRLAAEGIALSLIAGALFSVVLYLKIPVISKILNAYIGLARNTPLLVQLFLLYFGLPKIGVRLSGETCAIIGMAFLGGAYMAESLRSGLEAVERIQYESALSLGLSGAQTIRYVMFPQGLAIAIPGVTANIIFLIKETSVFSAVALADLMFVAKDLIGLYYSTGEALIMLVAWYIIILLPVSLLASYAERRIRRSGYGNI
ncbi:MAG: amino acid ABC transporter permease [Oscillospiraceae bacterium]|jgi:polar amino acid transport system permease protein|nr:amino acid ABC transporter permease [Oscillospiraceae bacterium]